MSDAEVQKRFSAGELVFTDGLCVFIRGVHRGYKDKPWECIDPNVSAFQGDPNGMAAWAMSKRSWTPDHATALVTALGSVGIELASWIMETREVRR